MSDTPAKTRKPNPPLDALYSRVTVSCGKKIFLEGTDEMANTYCMRPVGHEAWDKDGKCATGKTEDDRRREAECAAGGR